MKVPGVTYAYISEIYFLIYIRIYLLNNYKTFSLLGFMYPDS